MSRGIFINPPSHFATKKDAYALTEALSLSSAIERVDQKASVFDLACHFGWRKVVKEVDTDLSGTTGDPPCLHRQEDHNSTALSSVLYVRRFASSFYT